MNSFYCLKIFAEKAAKLLNILYFLIGLSVNNDLTCNREFVKKELAMFL